MDIIQKYIELDERMPEYKIILPERVAISTYRDRLPSIHHHAMATYEIVGPNHATKKWVYVFVGVDII